jgi:hypothetical protein
MEKAVFGSLLLPRRTEEANGMAFVEWAIAAAPCHKWLCLGLP